MMKNIFSLKYWLSTNERRMQLVRIIYMISYFMMILGFVIILLYFIFPDFFI